METRSKTRLPRGLAAAAAGVLVVAFVLSITPASAQAAEWVPVGSAPVHAIRLSISPEPTASVAETVSVFQSDEASVQSVISCSLRVDDPHKSTHVPGTINITAAWICSQAVASLKLDVYLYRNGLFVTRGTAGNTGRARLEINTPTACVSGTYKGVAIASVVFPPGYTPPTGSASGSSNSRFISCA